MRRRFGLWVIIAAAGIIIGGSVLVFRPLGLTATVLIPRNGASARPVVSIVHERVGSGSATALSGMIAVGARILSRDILPGWYHLQPSMSIADIASMLVRGKREPLVKVTIPEGYAIQEIARRLSTRAGIDSAKFVSWCTSDTTLRRFGIQAPSMEGFLMPDTYFMIRGDAADDVGSMMARQAAVVWKELVPATDERGWAWRKDIITLASIVQLEAARNDEMPTIAGVYQNRLRIGMRLQADPTVQYLTGKNRITGAELRDPSNSYNTYLIAGLPPGPIGNPGRNAIHAALRPESHEWLYFVARGDSTRRHRFARTLADHNANVRLYREARRSGH
ncbi:MAG: hypothetical protein RL594_880 [Bacteroidota bacterium]|jgi:UPF0755 protein